LAVAVEGAGAQLWDARTGDRVTPLEGCTEDAVGIALDGRGRVLVGGGEEGRLQPADLGSGCAPGVDSGVSVPEFIATGPDGRIAPGGVARTAWGPDGTLYAVTRWWGVILWDGQEWSPMEMP